MPAEPSVIRSMPADHGLRAWLRTPWQTLAMGGGLTYWAVGGLLYSLLGWPLRLLLPRRLGARIGRSMIHGGFRLFVGYLQATRLVEADLSGLERLRRVRGGFIIAPNHTSLWDAVFVISRLPQALCIMKRSILHNPVLGGGACLSGYIPAGNTGRMVRAAAAGLRAGGQLLMFPEGTRTRRERRWTNPFKGGIALIARKAEVPVYPVFIRSDSRYMEKGWPPWKRPEFPIRMEFELGEPLEIGPGESPQQFVARLQERFERELARHHPLRRQAAGDTGD